MRNMRFGILAVLLLTVAMMTAALTAFDPTSDPFAPERQRMVDEQIRSRGVESGSVLNAMVEVPRHLFVPDEIRDRAYLDRPQHIGSGQTISQPYIVALMTELLELDGDEAILEIGTGSGYQAAVLSRLAQEVYTIEIRDELAAKAKQTLDGLGYSNIRFRTGDGYAGWPEAAPFDGIIVTAAPPEVPETLVEQLKEGGRMVVPVGNTFQDLLVLHKVDGEVEIRRVAPVRFVPMVTDPGQ